MSADLRHSLGDDDLLLVVERLSTQNQRRIVRLIDYLARVPEELRATSQRDLKRQLSRSSIADGNSLERIDKVLAGIERQLAAAEDEPVSAASSV